jgi:ubiquinone/menaquinone biosynthesis C-methylase UbiE
LGEIVGRIMAHETSAANRIALDLLDLQPNDQVLDVGCGHGGALAAAAQRVTAGFLAGVDHSEVMLRISGARNDHLLRSGRMELKRADSRLIPYSDGRFNKVFTAHTIYFWPDLKEQFEEIRRVMSDDGRLVICYRPAEDTGFTAAFPESVYTMRSIGETETLVAEAGFRDVRTCSKSQCSTSKRQCSTLIAWTTAQKT